MATSAADARQPGGAHYNETQFQHWNLASTFKLGYFEGQITKYTDRHRRKHGALDLDKAIHFTEKLIEEACEGRALPMHSGYDGEMMDAFFKARRDLRPVESQVILTICTWNGTYQLQLALGLLRKLRREYDPESPDSAEG